LWSLRCRFAIVLLLPHFARDVHHGNGTQQAFYDDPSVLFISIHQDGMFPADSGHLAQIGAGAGEGYNVNIPIPPGSGIGCYDAAVARVIVPALHAFRPELVLVSCGFDAAAFDPLAHCVRVDAGAISSLGSVYVVDGVF
jgi:acetoin utilization deacetylase AcuC-like enzyme